MPSVARSYRLIDSDSHVNEPPDLWQSRVAARLPAPGPPHGALRGGRRLGARRGARPDHLRPQRLRRPASRSDAPVDAVAGHPRGGWDPASRLAEMDTDGVDAQILYPTPRLSHSIIANQDTEFHLALSGPTTTGSGSTAPTPPTDSAAWSWVPNRGSTRPWPSSSGPSSCRAWSEPWSRATRMATWTSSQPTTRLWRAVAESGYPLHIHVSMINEMPGAHKAKVIGAVRFWDAPTPHPSAGPDRSLRSHPGPAGGGDREPTADGCRT